MMEKKIFNKVNKISIIGGPGTGKTTLSNNLAKELNLPVYHLDGINYFENWVNRDVVERDKIIFEIVSKDKWIIDGNYNSTLEERLKNSDLIIFLDYSTIAKMKGIIGRHFKNKGKEKEEIPGCKERMSWWFIRLTFFWNIKKRKGIIELLKKNKDKEILIFKRRKNLNSWYRNEFNHDMKIK